MIELERFYDLARGSYELIAPSYQEINKHLIERGESEIGVDHIAFRTIDWGGISVETLDSIITGLGYFKTGFYNFPEKHLNANSYSSFIDPKFPRIFLSGFDTKFLTYESKVIIDRLVDQAGDQATQLGASVFYSGKLWDMISLSEYQTLADESEYLAWFATMGFQPNHFALSLNHTETISSVGEMLAFVESFGYKVNTSGGRIKGSSGLLLEQGSTMADRVDVVFSGGELVSVPGGYYEFALRYPQENGRLYDGFVSTSANKIFESTNNETEEPEGE